MQPMLVVQQIGDEKTKHAVFGDEFSASLENSSRFSTFLVSDELLLGRFA
jgi:hypothetical protein